MLYWILLGVHLLVCLIAFVLIRCKVLDVHPYMIFVALFVPFWGMLILLILHFQIAFEADGGAEIGVEKMRVESELYKSVTVNDAKVAASTVPIEEALLINSARERRSIIMDVLNDNPEEYVEFLQKAGNNEDTEVVHYAVTAMVEISKENDHLLQSFAERHREDPEDMLLLAQYIDFIWSCLSQHLMQGQVEVMNRELLATLLREKIEEDASMTDYIRFVQNELYRKNYAAAEEALDAMESLFPNTEELYMLRLHFHAETGNGEGIAALIEEVEKSRIYLSSGAKEALAFWGR